MRRVVLEKALVGERSDALDLLLRSLRLDGRVESENVAVRLLDAPSRRSSVSLRIRLGRHVDNDVDEERDDFLGSFVHPDGRGGDSDAGEGEEDGGEGWPW